MSDLSMPDICLLYRNSNETMKLFYSSFRYWILWWMKLLTHRKTSIIRNLIVFLSNSIQWIKIIFMESSFIFSKWIQDWNCSENWYNQIIQFLKIYNNNYFQLILKTRDGRRRVEFDCRRVDFDCRRDVSTMRRQCQQCP